ncbi:MAG: hypothetical protein A2Y77_18340 [Planctomycetes bacterium RBG_13_62_9]|nr:MAG: hypothetical protein A2Y77_18340 [Planctomycetes bacterium RBG_13_62_9]
MTRDSVIGQADLPCACAPATSAARIASIDRLRILAAIGIVWFHTKGAPGRQIAYAGLPIFLLIWFSLVASRDPLPCVRDFLRRAWDRLLAPWLFWSVVYAACKLVACVVLVACAALRATSYAIATVLVCLAYAWPSVGDSFVARVAPLTFGIYLIHPLAGYALRQSIAGALNPGAHVVCVVVMSGLVTLGLMHTPLRRCV